MREYKVVKTSKQRALGWKGNIRPQDLERLLNEHAADGWILDRIESSDSQWLGRDQLMVVFHREVAGGS